MVQQQNQQKKHAPAPPKARRPPAPAPPRGHGSQLTRFGSSGSSGTPPPPQVAAAATSARAALPTLNNRILQAHAAEVQAMQQAMLQEHLLAPRATQRAGPELQDPEDDAPLPHARYAGMAQVALPERDADTFDAWREGMEQLLAQRRLAQAPQQL